MEADCYSEVKKILTFYGTGKFVAVLTRPVYKTTILNPFNSLHTLMTYTFDFCCNIILWCTFKSSNVTSPFRFSGWVSLFPYLRYVYHLPVVHLSNFILCRLQTVMLSITQYHPTAFYLLCVCPKYLSSTTV